MSCSPFDLKDYFFSELSNENRRAVDQHVAACAGCRQELVALNLTRTALLAVPDEEPPRRIAFVSDKVFEPRWWQTIWHSGPKLGFISAAMLTAAILVHAQRPVTAPQAPAPQVQTVASAPGITEDELNRRVQKAVAEVESRQAAKFEQVLAKQKQMDFDQRAQLVSLEENFNVMRKTMGVMYGYRASADNKVTQ
ncbi:MAG TPA: zf-HC2 domain-containing protein [Bryobacteraceae bacterium]|nr:zf-HC2 domain-containing protein [Bryobacteraceae bacterium]